MTTRIEWCDETWNPIQAKIKGSNGRGYHCTKVSPGCDNCYAEATNILRGNGLPFDSRATEFELVTKTLEAPLHWKKPRRVFVQSMGDLFHEMVPFTLVDEVFKMMARCPQHTFMLLTKRPETMLGYLKWVCGAIGPDVSELVPPKNVWWGVTAENQEQADRRVPALLRIPAAIRFVSVEPMLGLVDLNQIGSKRKDGCISLWNVLRKSVSPNIDWVICGGESGKNARPMHPDWARSLRDQCQAAGIPFFFKQWGEWMPLKYQSDIPKGIISLSGIHVGKQQIWHWEECPECKIMKVGRKKSGRLLDGREWNEFPEVE